VKHQNSTAVAQASEAPLSYPLVADNLQVTLQNSHVCRTFETRVEGGGAPPPHPAGPSRAAAPAGGG